MASATLCLGLASQALGDPAARVFTTRDEAVRDLVTLRGNGADVVIGSDPVPPFDPSTNCALADLPSQLTGGGFTGVIGPNLSRHCDGPSNIISGTVLSAGIGSLGSTRTVSQPDLERDRQTFSEDGTFDQATPSTSPPTLNFAESASAFLSTEAFDLPQIALSFGGDAWTVFSEVGYRDVQADQTDFSAPFEADGIELRVGAIHQVTPTRRFGFLLDLSRISGELRSGSDLVANNAFVNDTPAFVPYRDLCGTDPVGDIDRDAIAGTVFADTRLRSGATLSYYATLEWQEEAYDSSACYTSETDTGGDDFVEIFAGRLSAEKQSRSITAGVRLDRSYRFGRATITPNVGFAAKHTHVPSYAESERAVDGRTIFTTTVGGGIVPTGTALQFDAQHINTAQARLGLDARVRAGRATVFTVDVAYVQELGDGQKRVTADFVEDGRAEPVSFSFLGAPVDRTYLEVGAGVATQIGSNTVIGLRGETLLKHDYVDDTRVSLQVSVRF
ncbi:autotransporter outer membrane beta-barrel domain-containing protein [Roseobacter sp. A03A-229]